MRGRSLLAIVILCALMMMGFTLSGCGGGAPVLSSVSPVSGEVGGDVTITGEGFGETQGSSGTVAFVSGARELKEWTDTKIVVAVPDNLKPGDYRVIVITDEYEASEAEPFNVKEAEAAEAEEAQQPEETATVETVFITYVEEQEPTLSNVTITDITVSADGNTAQATVNATYASGPNAGQPAEPATIKASRQNGAWVVTGMETGPE